MSLATPVRPDRAPAAATPMSGALSWWWFLALAACAWLPSLAYVWRTYANVVYEDGFEHLPAVGAALDGDFSPDALLYQPFYGEHLYLGYRAVVIANAALFDLSMKVDPVLFLLAYTIIAGVLFWQVRATLPPARLLPRLLVPTVLTFLAFSLVAPPFLLMTTQFVWGSALALLIAALLQSGLYGPRLRRPWLFACALVPIYYLLSGAYFPGFLVGLALMHLARTILEPGGLRDRRLWGFLGVVSASTLAYLALLTTVGGWGEASASSGPSPAVAFFTDPGVSALSYVAGAAAAVVDSHTIEAMSDGSVLTLGAGVLAVTLLALVVFVRTGMHRVTYLPVYCIGYSLGVITAVRLGRGGLEGWRAPAAEWYAFHLRFLVVGVTWVLLHALVLAWHRRRATSPSARPWAVAAGLTVSLTFVLAGQAVGNASEWERGPAVKAWLMNKERALLYPELFDDPATVLLADPAQVAAGREVLRVHRLSAFDDPTVEPASASLIPGEGFFEDGWATGESTAVLPSATSRPAVLALQVPPYGAAQRVVLTLNGRIVLDRAVAVGGEDLQVELVEGNNMLEVSAPGARSPLEAGAGADERRLAVNVRPTG